MKLIRFIIRIGLSLLLLYGVYTETGIWTAISMFLCFVALEAHSFILNNKEIFENECYKR